METIDISGFLTNAIAFVIFVGYFILGVLVYKQVGILCRMLGTNLSALIRLAALLHIMIIMLVGVLLYFLL